VSVKTGHQHGAGTDANVFVVLHGSNGDTGSLRLMSADNNRNKFEAGRIDLFKLESTDIGKVYRPLDGHLPPGQTAPDICPLTSAPRTNAAQTYAP